MDVILIKPAEITATTILGGNLDPSRYVINVLYAQLNTLEPLLGSLLYNKIVDDFKNDDLKDEYLYLFENFVAPIVKYEAVAQYIEVGNYLVENGGTFTHTADNRGATTKDDTQFLAGKYHAMAQMYIHRFERWICANPIAEYSTYVNGEVNARKVKVTSGWWFGSDSCNCNDYR